MTSYRAQKHAARTSRKAVHGVDCDGNATVREARYDVLGTVREDGSVVTYSDNEDETWDSPDDYSPHGLAVCDSWTVQS